MTTQRYDAVVLGAGLGGLLAAARLARRGQRVAVIERLDHVGGRFTAKTFQGAQVSTGAVHMLPFGTNGIVAAMLRDLKIPHAIHDAEVFGSFLVHGRQVRARSLIGLARVVGPRQFPELVRLGYAILLRPPRAAETDLTFAQWLITQGITRASHREMVLFFERVAHFTLSVDLDQVAYTEVAAILKNMLRYGPPGIVAGGCAAVANALADRLQAAGVDLLLSQEAHAIQTHAGAVTGVTGIDRMSGATWELQTTLLVSDIGPAATAQLMPATATGPDSIASPFKAVATGLKTHILSENSLIDHQGILYCLDTERIAGIVQPSNSDRSLAPPGQHLIITHQLWRPDHESIAEARAHARADLANVLGPGEGDRWRVLTMGQYHDAWPVNRAIQGRDSLPETTARGLYLVGDAVKPSGYLMVEGVAQSVNDMLAALDRALPGMMDPLPAHAIPGRRRAMHWLVGPPPPDERSAPPQV